MDKEGFVLKYVVDLDAVFREVSCSRNITLLNGIDLLEENERARLHQQALLVQEETGLTSVPSCPCGKLTGRHYIGVTHHDPKCNGKVRDVVGDHIPSVWFRVPVGIPGLINLSVMSAFRSRFSSGGLSMIDWIINPTYRVKPSKQGMVDQCVQLGLKRGYDYFVENFDAIITILKQVFKKPAKEEDYDLEFLRLYRHNLFMDHQPLPSLINMLTERTPLGSFLTAAIRAMPPILTLLAGIDLPEVTHRTKLRRLGRAWSMLADYAEAQYKQTHQGKYNHHRRHQFGVKPNGTGRFVLIPNTGESKHNEIHLPWVGGLEMYRYHFISGLLHEGKNMHETCREMYVGAYNPTPSLIKIADRLVSGKYGGLPLTITRNPSLAPGNVQVVRAVKFKYQKPDDHTITVPYILFYNQNGDADGDTNTPTAFPDEYTAQCSEHLKPCFSFISLTEHGKLSGTYKLPAPAVSILTSFLSDTGDMNALTGEERELLKMFAD